MEKYIKSVTKATLMKANEIFGKTFKPIEIRYDIQGKCAGQYCVQGDNEYFRYNMDIAKKNGKEVFKTTVVHEIAHYITKCLHPEYIRPHGKEWKSVMIALGINDPKTTHIMKCAPARKVKRVPVKCSCMTHMITVNMRTKILNGSVRICKKCKTKLVIN